MIASKNYKGYLSFLPPPDSFTPQEAPFKVHLDAASQHQYRTYHSRDFCWFEFKDVLPEQPLQFSIETKDNYLWMFIQLLGSGKIAIVPTLYVADGKVYCYQLNDRKKHMALGPGKKWFFLLGIAQSHWPDIAAEYPLVQPIAEATTPEGLTHGALLCQTSVQAKLTATLDALSRFEFRPFSLSFRLAASNLRLFNLVFQELKSPEKPQEDTLITLYYKATHYIRENFREEALTAELVAKTLHVSPRKLESRFENQHE